MREDKNFCMSSYLAIRYVFDEEKVFKMGMPHREIELMPSEKKTPCGSAAEISDVISSVMGG